MEEPKYCLVQFKYTCTLDKDEEVRVVGGPNELGGWDVAKSEKMVFSKLDQPVWKTKENIKIMFVLYYFYDISIFHKYVQIMLEL